MPKASGDAAKLALARLLLVFLDGRNYNSQNPYTRPEVKEALAALGLADGDAEAVRALAHKASKP